MSVTVLTDSTADITAIQARTLGITVMPLMLAFGQERLRDGIDINRQEFYARMAASKDLPTTLPIAEADFASAFEKAVSAGNDVVAVVVSGGVSETYKNAVAAAAAFPGKVYVVDSQTFSGGLFMQARYAVEVAKGGKSAAEVAKEVERVRATQRGFFITPDLSHLGRSGRLNKAIVALGTMMKVNPILRMQNGVVDSAAQTRTFEKAQELLLDIAIREVRDASSTSFVIGHAHSPDLGAAFLKSFQERLGSRPRSLELYEAGPSIGIHGGAGSLGFFSLTV